MVICATRLALVLALSTAWACGSSSSASDKGPDSPVDVPLSEIDYGQEDVPGTDAELPLADSLDPDADGDADVVPCAFVTSPQGFRDNCDGTVTDTNTGWTWEKSYQWAAGVDEAKKSCLSSRTGGFNDWQLPTIDEMRTLILGCPDTGPTGACPVHALANCIDESCRTASCNGCATNQGPVEKPGDPTRKCYLDGSFDWYCNLFWTQTQVKAKTPGYKRAWYVTFYDAAIDVPPTMAVIQSWAMRCVRAH